MTFIEMLQQGGYILPQYAPGQQSYQAPAAGMQALNTMMQIDQQGQNRYIQGEQLNMQRAASLQNTIDSSIRNKISLETNERMKKQMDLSNAKLEFDMQKAILNDMKAQREELKTMFLNSDQAHIQKMLEDKGLDEAGVLRNMQMKGGINFKNYMENAINSRALINAQKNALDRKYKYDQGEKFIADAEKQLARADAMHKTGALDYDAYIAFTRNLNDSTKQLIDYNNGKETDLNFTDATWSGIISAPDFLDEVQAEHNLEIERKTKNAKMLEDLANAQMSEARANQITAMTPGLIAKTNAETQQMLAQLPSEIALMEAKGMLTKAEAQIALESAKQFNSLWEEYLRDNPDATADEKARYFNQLKGRLLGNAGASLDNKPLSAAEMYTKAYYEGDQAGMDAAMRWQTANNNKSTDVNYKYDGQGNPEAVVNKDGSTDYGGRVLDKDGTTVISVTVDGESYKITGGSGKDKNKVIGLPFDASLTELIDPTTGKKKGYLKIKGNNTVARDWVYGKYGENYGWTTANDELEAFPTKDKAPEGTIYKEGYLYIPQDDIEVTVPAATSISGSGIIVPEISKSQTTPSKGVPNYAK